MKRFHSVFYFGIFILWILVFWFWGAGEARAWWNDKWQYRQKIQFDTTPAGADIQENLSDLPVLIRLHAGNLNFSNTRDDGVDIRFVKGDDVTPLKHHIERFDPVDEIALIWVKVPRITAGGNQDFVFMYYGNEEAMGGQDAGGTFDVQYVGVYHLGEAEGTPRDATAFDNHPVAFAGGQGLPSLIGNGAALNGAGDRITMAQSPSMTFVEGLTFSAWVRIAGPVQDGYLFAHEEEGKGIVVGIDETKVYCRVKVGEKILETERTADLALQTWHHVAVTIEPKNRMSVFLDGILMTWKDFPVDLPEMKGDILIGASVEEDHDFYGDVDEVRLSNRARTVGWFRSSYRGQGPEGKLVVYGVEEIGGGSSGLPTFYLATVMRNITLDGWTIIAILMIFSLLSWLIFFSKAFTLAFISRGNRHFWKSFSDSHDLRSIGDDENDYEQASLFRIYRAGGEELRKWIGEPEPDSNPGYKPLPQKGLNAVKTALEEGYVRETQRLNTWLVILVMAISGGPFLGLLGTVWGVMNTFAAMAEAGEANIMAIAPGVASALSTTVFGLIVAIPALFGYNYLANKIKGITAEMGVFVDRFALKADEFYGGAAS